MVIRCSLGWFCTFGVTARGVLHYREAIRDSSLKFDVDAELIGWLDKPFFVFVWQLLEVHTTSFELPFLSQSHKLGVSRALEYKNFLMSWVDFVEDWWHNPEGAFFHLPPLETLPDEQREVVLLMIAAVHDTFQKHVVPHVNNGDGFTSSTNRVGETVFRYMRACFDQNQSTRMVLVASHFIVARSKYLKLVISEPWRMKQVMNRVSKRLDSPECRYLTYCYLWLSELVKENEQKKARAVAKDRESKLRGRLVVAKFLPKDVGDLTVEHLKKATRGLRQREPDLIDFLRLNVNREQLMNQLEDWVGSDNVC